MPIVLINDKEVIVIESNITEDLIQYIRQLLKTRKDIEKITITGVSECTRH